MSNHAGAKFTVPDAITVASYKLLPPDFRSEVCTLRKGWNMIKLPLTFSVKPKPLCQGSSKRKGKSP